MIDSYKYHILGQTTDPLD